MTHRAGPEGRTMTRVRRAAVSVGLRAPGAFLWLAISWTLFAGVFGVGLLFVVDRVPLGPEIRPATTLYLADAILTSLGFVLLISGAGVLSTNRPSGGQRWTRRQILTLMAVVAGAFGIWAAGMALRNETIESRTRADASAARHQFQVVTYSDELEQTNLD